MIHVERLRLTVYEDEHRDEKRLKGTFDHRGETYTMQVKDVEFENECQERNLGTYVANDRYLTINLAGEFNDYCYKLIAGDKIADYGPFNSQRDLHHRSLQSH